VEGGGRSVRQQAANEVDGIRPEEGAPRVAIVGNQGRREKEEEVQLDVATWQFFHRRIATIERRASRWFGTTQPPAAPNHFPKQIL
jgi:hypothetical protein